MKRPIAALVLALSLPDATPARACGGCFAPSSTVTTVSSHRMVISLSTGRTTLWDQIRYTGNPQDFVWVLPVPSGAAEVELASASFFDELDAQTAPIVQAPSLPPLTSCPNGGGFGCGGGVDLASPEPPSDDVTVFSEETIGPYETVVIGAEDPDALYVWLTDRGYRVPEETLPTIGWYVEQGSAFVVLRLSPGLGVQAMQPVRVTYPGYMATFPLRMVTVGAQGVLELALWVFAEQRFEARNYATLEIDPNDLIWDWSTNRSNYDRAFDDAIDRAGGRAWIVEHVGLANDLTLSVESAGDLATAMAGRGTVTTTRLRTRMLVDHLEEDLELRPGVHIAHLGPLIVAGNEINRAADVECDEGACGVSAGRRLPAGFAAIAVGIVCLLIIRRRGTR